MPTSTAYRDARVRNYNGRERKIKGDLEYYHSLREIGHKLLSKKEEEKLAREIRERREAFKKIFFYNKYSRERLIGWLGGVYNGKGNGGFRIEDVFYFDEGKRKFSDSKKEKLMGEIKKVLGEKNNGNGGLENLPFRVNFPLDFYLSIKNNSDWEHNKKVTRKYKEYTESRNNFLGYYLRLVINVAKGFKKKGLELIDLIQEGDNGLVKAVDRFNPKGDGRFSTYAVYWINQKVRRALSINRGINSSRREEGRVEIERIKARLRSKLHREPSLKEIARESGIKPGYIKDTETIFRIYQGKASLDKENDRGNRFIETIGDKRGEKVDIPSIRSELEKYLDVLSEREKMIIRLRYGLDDGGAMTLQEVGDVLGLTRERIRQIEKIGMEKIKRKAFVLNKDD